MSFSFNKLRTLLPQQNSLSSTSNSSSYKNPIPPVNLDPQVGFQISIELNENSTNNDETYKIAPELNVQLIAARHLPSAFGLKSVQGFCIKVKLFPGAKRYDSHVQTSSWPKFNENFKFSLAPEKKPSLKRYTKDKQHCDNSPETLLTGYFVVFTVYALLELPPGTFNRFNKTYRSLRDKGNTLLQKVTNETKDDSKATKSKKDDDQFEIVPQLTKSESKRNIGSVTCYLEPKLFKRNLGNGNYNTEEMWLPIKDINSSHAVGSSSNVTTATKGQIELILEVNNRMRTSENELSNTSTNTKETVEVKRKPSFNNIKRHLSLSEVKRKIVHNHKQSKSDPNLVLKISTTKMRCSIKVKDEFENFGLIYIKTTIFKHDIWLDSWKCQQFLPSLSTKWNPDESTITIPLSCEEDLKSICIKTSVGTKTKLGKKIFLGSVTIHPLGIDTTQEHLKKAILNKNEPCAIWYSFE